MKKWLKILAAILGAALLIGAYYWYQANRPVTVEALLDPGTRLRTFHRLWSKEERHEMYDSIRNWGNFRDYHEAIDILKCPQGEAEPLYLITRSTGKLHVISNRKSPFDSLAAFTDSAAWSEWWGRFGSSHKVSVLPELSPALIKLDHKNLDLVDHTGKRVERPFGGNNVSDGYFYDLDRDGFLERADTTNYGFDEIPGRKKIEPEVLEVARVKRKEEPLFSVIINLYKEDDWGYRCEDVDGDGLVEILIGPESPGGSIPPAVTFHWDEAQQTFIDRDASESARRPYWILEKLDPWKKVRRLHKSGELADYWLKNRP